SVPAIDSFLLRNLAPVGRRLVGHEPVKVIHYVPVISVSVQPRRLEILLD
ncbi:hypothetical protein N331_11451, partial [Merops nubicus]